LSHTAKHKKGYVLYRDTISPADQAVSYLVGNHRPKKEEAGAYAGCPPKPGGPIRGDQQENEQSEYYKPAVVQPESYPKDPA
jgi:hypothetical protein